MLVALGKLDNGTFQCFPVDISSDSGPSYILGRSPRTEIDTLAWFKDPNLNVFCFPTKTVGPDLVAIFMLADGRRLPILLQFKNHIQKTLGVALTEDSLRTTDPKQFISQVATDNKPSDQPPTEDPTPVKKNKKLYALGLCFIHVLTS
jgi:hypothetical protein